MQHFPGVRNCVSAFKSGHPHPGTSFVRKGNRLGAESSRELASRQAPRASADFTGLDGESIGIFAVHDAQATGA